MNLFNYEKAVEALGGDAFGLAWLEANREKLEALGAAALDEILALIAAGKLAEAMAKFTGNPDWQTIAAGAAADVTNTAEMATRAAEVREMLASASAFAVKALLAAVVAGFCL